MDTDKLPPGVDWVVAEAALRGERVAGRTSSEERAALARYLEGQGVARSAIAARLGMSGATVNRLLGGAS